MKFIPWSSQPRDEWAAKYAPGQFIDLNGHQAHYIERGNGPPVILLHGFGSDSFTWHGNIDALATKFKVYAMDFWGCGYSSRELILKGNRVPGYELYANQLRTFMDVMKIERPFLVGQSMGAGTVVYFATTAPQRIRGIILVGPAGMPDKISPAQSILALPGIGEIVLGLPTDFFRKMLIKKVFIHSKELAPEYYGGLTWSQKIKGSNQAYLKIVRAKFFHTIGHKYVEFGKLNIPTLIIWGKYDRGNYLNTELLRLIPHARVTFFEHSAHEPHDEEPERFNHIASEFLLYKRGGEGD